jgi:hypothetical protein
MWAFNSVFACGRDRAYCRLSGDLLLHYSTLSHDRITDIERAITVQSPVWSERRIAHIHRDVRIAAIRPRRPAQGRGHKNVIQPKSPLQIEVFWPRRAFN